MTALQRRAVWLWREWVKPLLVVGLVLFSFRSAIADWNDVPTGSMKPTILEGERVFVNKMAYDLKVPFTTWRITEWSDPQRGDVVVLYSPYDGKRLIKRVIGIPGDRVAMRDQHLVINGNPAVYAPLNPAHVEGADKGSLPFEETGAGWTHPILTTPGNPSVASFAPVVVPQDSYLVMGDNRDNSFDSRYFGYVKLSQILGRAVAVVASFDINHSFRPRWDRFFTRLQ